MTTTPVFEQLMALALTPINLLTLASDCSCITDSFLPFILEVSYLDKFLNNLDSVQVF
jgi:hypothetical protein